MKRCFFLVCLIVSVFLYLLLFCPGFVYADEVYLKNGDRIGGKIVEEQEESIVIDTKAIASITINKKFVERTILHQMKE